MNYILENGKPKAVSLLEWAKWIEDLENKRIDYSEVGPWFVSTVFLGIDHGFGGGPPVLFETMVFERKLTEKKGFPEIGIGPYSCHQDLDEYTERYCHLEDAREGHKKIVEQLEANLRSGTE